MEESRKQPEKAKQVYESMIEAVPSPLGFINYIRFARRREDGQDAARKIFMQAKKSPQCSWQVYVAYALIEAHSNKADSVARKIFELGLKEYLTEPKYVCEYIDFLLQLKDVQNMRVLCDRVLAGVPPEKTPEVWAKLLEFEYAYGDHPTIEKQVARCAAMLPELTDHPLIPPLQRFRWRELWPCSGEVFKEFSNQRAATVAKKAVYTKKKARARPKKICMPNLAEMKTLSLEPPTKIILDVPEVIMEFIAQLPPAALFAISADGSPANVERIMSLCREYTGPAPGAIPAEGETPVVVEKVGEKRPAPAPPVPPAAPRPVQFIKNDQFKQRKMAKSRDPRQLA